MEIIVKAGLKMLELDMSTGTGEATYETEEINGYLEAICFETENELALVIDSVNMPGLRILDLRTRWRYFTPRISPNDSEGNRFNFGAQRIALLGPLRINISGAVGKEAKIKILYSEV